MQATERYPPFITDLKTHRHRWAVNKWQRLVTLINNHSLVLEQLSKNARENLTVEESNNKKDHVNPRE